MENGKSLKLIFLNLILATLLLPVFCYSYSDKTTHPALANEAVDVFNYKYPELNLSENERNLIVKGSIKEDNPFYRPVNHFFDPVYNVGLLNINLSAKNWSQNTKAQAGFGNLAGIGLIKGLFSANSDYSWDRAIYDYVYGDKERSLESLGHNLHLIQDMAVPPHTRNDQHLTGVDNSPYESFTKQFDINKLSDFSNKLQNEDIVIKNTLDGYFDNMANFTNSNFFSKDTILKGKYTKPSTENEKIYSMDGELIIFVYGKADNKEFKLSWVDRKRNEETGLLEESYFIKDRNDLILTDYWNILSKQAVLHSAGVVKLFFDDVEKEKRTQFLFNKNKSVLDKVSYSVYEGGQKVINTGKKVVITVKNTAVKVSVNVENGVSKGFNSVIETIGKLGKKQNMAIVVGSLQNKNRDVLGEEEKWGGQESLLINENNKNVEKPVDIVGESDEVVLDYGVENQENQGIEVENEENLVYLSDELNNDLNNELVVNLVQNNNSQGNNSQFQYPGFGFGGGGGSPTPEEPEKTQDNLGTIQNQSEDSTSTEESKESQGDSITNQNKPKDSTSTSTPIAIIVPNAPVITTPNLIKQASSTVYSLTETLTTTSITFEGTASSTNIISTDFSNATTSADQNDSWSLTLENLNQGTTTVNFYASNQEQTATSSATIVEMFVDSEPPNISLNIDGCSQSSCLIVTATTTITTLNAEWLSSAEDLDYFLINQNGTTSTTTATTTQINLSGNQIYTFSVKAVDKVGNESQEVSQNIEINDLPVVINEVAWAGTASSSADEWIELYNNTDQDIDLSNWILYSDDNSPNISLQNTIPAKGYYLIERKNGGEVDELTQSPIVDIPADLWVSFGSGLKNNGEELILARIDENYSTTTIDRIAKKNNWGPNGASVSHIGRFVSMERLDSNKPSGDNLENWSSALYRYITNGTDTEGNKILGTPKRKNGAGQFLSRNGKIETNRTLKKSESPYLIDYSSFTLKEGVTLDIEAGVVIKFVSHSGIAMFRVQGTIISHGTKENPVVFTSLYDDEYGGDMNTDGICDPNNASSTAKCPNIGDWRQVWIESTSQNSKFDNTIFRYGGGFRDGDSQESKAMVTVSSTDVIFNNSVFENSKTKGLYLVDVSDKTEVVNSVIRSNNYTRPILVDYPYGIQISGGSPKIENNIFEGNGYGLLIGGGSSVMVSSNIFNNNEQYAVYSYGINSFSNNSGENNKVNGIIIRGALTSENIDNTLKKNSLPYFINENVSVSASSTLMIDSGVVLKFIGKRFDVFGRIEINGDSENRVLFTSVKDDSSDSVDVNNNIEPDDIIPFRGSGLYLRKGSSSIIKGAEFKYLDKAVSYENSPIYLDDVIFRNNNIAVTFDIGSATSTINNIVFEGNTATSTKPLW